MNKNLRYSFLNQYAKIPAKIQQKLDARYENQYDSVRHCLGLIVVNLLVNREVAYSRRKGFYSENGTHRFTYKSMLMALKIAEDDGFAVQLQRGQPGVSSIMGAGDRLEEFERPEKLELDVEALPLLAIDDRPVFNHDDLLGMKSKLDDDVADVALLRQRLDKVYDEALTLNRDYWNRICIDTSGLASPKQCISRVGLTRIFNNGLMGRWYQKGESSFQQLPKRERFKLRINDYPVTEIDYSAMHPHLLYAWAKEQCPADFYERIMDECGCSRFIAKNVVLYAINVKNYGSLNGAVNNAKRRELKANRYRDIPEPILYDEIKKIGLTVERIVEAINKVHPKIQQYLYSGAANRLMLAESEIMTSVLLKLKELNIPAIPIHDSVIVPSRYEDDGRRVMLDCYEEHIGFAALVNNAESNGTAGIVDRTA